MIISRSPLCGNRIDGPPIRVHRIDAAELTKIIAIQIAFKKVKAEP
jgi:hypothetical protein